MPVYAAVDARAMVALGLFVLVWAGYGLARGQRPDSVRGIAGRATIGLGFTGLGLATGTGAGLLFVAAGGFTIVLAMRGVASRRVRPIHRSGGRAPAARRLERATDGPPPPPLAVRVTDVDAPAAVEPLPATTGGVIRLLVRQATTPSALRRHHRRVLYLWVFDGEPDSMVVGSLRRLGPVHLLRGADAVATLGELRTQLLRPADAVCETEPEVVEAIARFRRPTRGRFDMFPLHSLLCNGAVWTYAVDRLLERSDVVVMDLSAYAAHRAGCTYELGLLVDRVPLDRVWLRVDDPADTDRVVEAVGPLWATMAASSPNRSGSSPLRLVVCGRGNGSGPRLAELVATTPYAGRPLPPPPGRPRRWLPPAPWSRPT